MFAEFVVFYGASCQTGNCPNVQKSPVATFQVIEAPIYRTNPLAGILRKKRAVSVIVIVPSESKSEEVGKISDGTKN